MPDSGRVREMRVLVAAPTRRDATVTCALLGGVGIVCEAFSDLPALADAVRAGVGAVMLTDAAMAASGISRVREALADQPDWSDVPVILLAPHQRRPAAARDMHEAFANLTLLERPVTTRSMLSTVSAALRARRRQYQLRDQLAELRVADQALREADQRKDQFLATLAHELRNPLAPIRTGLEVLERAPGDAIQATRVHAIMRRQLAQLVQLIDDLLDVSRIATGKVALRREIVDLRDVVESAIEGSQPLIDGAGHALEVHLPPQPVGVFADPLRLGQVIGNLVNNAAKYTPPGGRIEVTLVREADDAVVRVADNGVGIDGDMLGKVFDMFAQADQTLDQAQGGLGIGLSLVRQLMDLHGGSVWVESAGRARGSVFSIRLATTPMHIGAAPAAFQAPADARANPRVLVIDDNVDAADSLTMFLELEGCETRVAYSADAALRTAAEFRPEAILCDVGLPEMDGCELARRLRADPAHAHALLVALTGLGSDEDKRKTRDAGFDVHLVKPVALSELQRIIERL